ncbi:hypothetical protein HDV57DRAFT_52186 [Trichoderma longibrachiatum]|uniref:Uncharacterized protein n=1 Tax=Trichoderma longibrachiatum ATCC 18648 TaxID=983965 RepID=A0A2T4C0M8_TRILO|nr:hypothetical protein M440DRAFT_1267623 [Trichoderma longibrachiatum ATCC 18648]
MKHLPSSAPSRMGWHHLQATNSRLPHPSSPPRTTFVLYVSRSRSDVANGRPLSVVPRSLAPSHDGWLSICLSFHLARVRVGLWAMYLGTRVSRSQPNQESSIASHLRTAQHLALHPHGEGLRRLLRPARFRWALQHRSGHLRIYAFPSQARAVAASCLLTLDAPGISEDALRYHVEANSLRSWILSTPS